MNFQKRSDPPAAMDGGPREDVVSRCIEALANAGAPPEFCNFYADVIKCEYDMIHTMYRMQKDLKDVIKKEPLNCNILFTSIQAMTKKFYTWKGCVDNLAERGCLVPPLKLNADKLSETQSMVKALCSLETTEMNLHEGEEILITDTTRPDRLRVRNSRGEEGYVPALCCLLPSPDDNATNAVERLQVHLLTSWTDCVHKVKRLLFDNLNALCKLLAISWGKSESCLLAESRDRDRIGRRFRRLTDSATLHENGIDLSRLHKALISLEKELQTLNSSELHPMIGTVSNLDKAVLCYHSMYKQWRNFRHSLKQAPHPIRLVQHLDQLREIAHGKNFKYYEMKMTLDETEILEEITYISAKTGERIRVVLPGGTGAIHEALSAEQITSTSLEEKKCFIIRSVVDRRDDSEISLREALSAGIIDPGRGVYVNLSTGKPMAIPLAMNEGLIKVEYVSTKRSAEKTEAVGLITIRTRIDHHDYLITGAFDALTGERVSADEARRRGLINEPEDWYLIGTTDERLPLIQAIDQGWVFASYEDANHATEVEPTYEVHTYAVREVKDHARQTTVGFAEAVRRGLIDRETGDFVNSLTGERMHVVDAIQKGTLQATLVKDVAGMNVSPSNAVVVDRIQKVNRRIAKGTHAIAALRHAGKNQ